MLEHIVPKLVKNKLSLKQSQLTLEIVLVEFIKLYRIDKDRVPTMLNKCLVKMHKRFHLVNEENRNWIQTLVQDITALIKVQMLLDLVLLSQILEIKAVGKNQRLIQVADLEHINHILVVKYRK